MDCRSIASTLAKPLSSVKLLVAQPPLVPGQLLLRRDRSDLFAGLACGGFTRMADRSALNCSAKSTSRARIMFLAVSPIAVVFGLGVARMMRPARPSSSHEIRSSSFSPIFSSSVGPAPGSDGGWGLPRSGGRVAVALAVAVHAEGIPPGNLFFAGELASEADGEDLQRLAQALDAVTRDGDLTVGRIVADVLE